MGRELRVKFLGDYPDARKVVSSLDKLVSALTAASPAGSAPFGFSYLGLGSVEALLTPLPASQEAGEEAFGKIVAGLAEAEQAKSVPADWDAALTKAAKELLTGADDGIEMTLLEDGERLRQVRVTEAARRNLDAILSSGGRDSIGSVIGKLDSVTLHERRRAWLWPDNQGSRIEIRFDQVQRDLIRGSLGTRVEAFGRLRRDRFGDIVYLTLRGLDVLPGAAGSPPLSELAGSAPDITGGKTAAEYLREMRGKAL
jgi:hypothetical protein